MAKDLDFVDCQEDFDFDTYVKEKMSEQLTGFELERITGTTSEGKRYIFVITKILWYATRLIIEPYCYKTCQKIEPTEAVERKAFYLKDEMDKYIEKQIAKLEEKSFLGENNKTKVIDSL